MSSDMTLSDIPVVDPREIAADPHAVFARWRPETPLIRYGERMFAVLRAADVIALMSDARTRQIEGEMFVKLRGIPEGALARFLSDLMLFRNDEPHRRRRAPFVRGFSQPVMKGYRTGVRTQAEAMVAALPRGVALDFLEGLAGRLPGEIIAGLLGIPAAEVPRFTRLVYLVSLALAPVFPPERFPEVEAAAAGLEAFTRELVAERRANPGEDLLSQALRAMDGDDALTPEEFVHQVMGIILAGSDTTRAAFAMVVSLLLGHPDQWQAVVADPALAEGAVAEGLRYEPSVGSVPRFAAVPMEVGGVPVPAGVNLGLSTLSAMRDPALYADPSRFDIRRNDHPRLHFVFGGGPHRCLGEMLARIEMEEALKALAAAAPQLELLTAPRLQGFGGIRQISPMTVRIG
jgi:hypothetical protein